MQQKKIICLIYLLIGVCAAYAQRVPVTDPNFAAFLCEKYPASMNATCDSINIPSARTAANGTMNFARKGITNIDEIVNYISTDVYIGYNNSITTVPILPASLDSVDLSNNLIKEVQEPFLPELSDLIYIDLTDNVLETMPNLYRTRSIFKEIHIGGNELYELLDFEEFPLLTNLNIANNRLTFEDLLPVVNLPIFNPTTFIVGPQQPSTFPETSFESLETASFHYELFFDKDVEGSTYKWFKNGVLYQTTTENSLDISNVSLSDSGVYTVRITNSHTNLQGVELYFNNTFHLEVIPSIHVLTNIIQSDCETHEVLLNKKVLSTLTDGAEYLLIDSITNVSSSLDVNSFTLTSKGQFDLVQLNNGVVVQYLKNWVKLPVLPSCIDVITPNGDNVDDIVYFEEEGEIKIFGKAGGLLKELQGPVIWDITDKTGTLLEPGLYLILLPNGNYRSISILY